MKVHCLNCIHYKVTWDKRFPYGCSAWSIRSKQYPCIEVRAASGLECQKFQPKKRPAGGSRGGKEIVV